MKRWIDTKADRGAMAWRSRIPLLVTAGLARMGGSVGAVTMPFGLADGTVIGLEITDPSLVDTTVDSFIAGLPAGTAHLKCLLPEEVCSPEEDGTRDRTASEVVRSAAMAAKWPPWKIDDIPFLYSHRGNVNATTLAVLGREARDVLFVSASDRTGLAEATWPSWHEYAQFHGYGFLPIDTTPASTPPGQPRPPGVRLHGASASDEHAYRARRSEHHLKLWLLHDLIVSAPLYFDTIVWVDDDIRNTAWLGANKSSAWNIRFEDLLASYFLTKNIKDVIAVQQLEGTSEPFNTGIVVARRGAGDPRTSRAAKLLRDAWLAPLETADRTCLLKECWFHENTALGLAAHVDPPSERESGGGSLAEVLSEMGPGGRTLVLLPSLSLQGYWGAAACGTELLLCSSTRSVTRETWRPGVFSAHASGYSAEGRVARLKLLDERMSDNLYDAEDGELVGGGGIGGHAATTPSPLSGRSRAAAGLGITASYAEYREALYVAFIASGVCEDHGGAKAAGLLDTCSNFVFLPSLRDTTSKVVYIERPQPIPQIEQAVLDAYQGNAALAVQMIRRSAPSVTSEGSITCAFKFAFSTGDDAVGTEIGGYIVGRDGAELRSRLVTRISREVAKTDWADNAQSIADTVIDRAQNEGKCQSTRSIEHRFESFGRHFAADTPVVGIAELWAKQSRYRFRRAPPPPPPSSTAEAAMAGSSESPPKRRRTGSSFDDVVQKLNNARSMQAAGLITEENFKRLVAAYNQEMAESFA